MATFYLLKNSTHSQMFGCVIQTQDHTIVIDGGTLGDDEQLVTFLREKANSHVDAWFFTHPHHDHIGAFVGIRTHNSDIAVDKVYHCFPSTNELQPYACSEDEKVITNDIEHWASSYDIHQLSVNEIFQFDDVAIRVLRVFNPVITENFINNSSTVYRIEGKNGSFLILGDLGIEGGNELMKNCPLALLKADYTQMAHHGQWGVSKEFYDYIKPQKCIWASPDWLWNNDAGEGYDTGPWQTVRTREWVTALGVTEHIVEKDGLQKIEF